MGRPFGSTGWLVSSSVSECIHLNSIRRTADPSGNATRSEKIRRPEESTVESLDVLPAFLSFTLRLPPLAAERAAYACCFNGTRCRPGVSSAGYHSVPLSLRLMNELEDKEWPKRVMDAQTDERANRGSTLASYRVNDWLVEDREQPESRNKTPPKKEDPDRGTEEEIEVRATQCCVYMFPLRPYLRYLAWLFVSAFGLSAVSDGCGQGRQGFVAGCEYRTRSALV